MDFEAARPVTGRDLEALKSQFASMNTLGWKYIPKTGAPGAALSQFVLYPQGVEVEKAQAGTGSLEWIEQTPMQNPAQYYIINSLASLPVKRVKQAVLMEGRAVLHAMGARVIE